MFVSNIYKGRGPKSKRVMFSSTLPPSYQQMLRLELEAPIYSVCVDLSLIRSYPPHLSPPIACLPVTTDFYYSLLSLSTVKLPRTV